MALRLESPLPNAPKMKNVQNLFAALLLMCALSSANGQTNRLYSLYMFNPLILNPAYAGSQNQLVAVAVGRLQWVGVEGSPETQMLSLHAGSKRKPVGLGLTLSHESIGIHDNTQVTGSYAYQIRGRDYKLSFGLQAGVEFNQVDFNKLALVSQDPLAQGAYSTVKPNIGFGIYYSAPKGYSGFSVPFLLENRLEKDGTSVLRNNRYYFFTAGRIFKLNREIVFKPSFLTRFQSGNALSFDISGTFYYKKTFAAGASLRSAKSLALLLEMQLTDRLRFGYAYDASLNKLSTYTTGSHELMLSFRMPLTPAVCHTYF